MCKLSRWVQNFLHRVGVAEAFLPEFLQLPKQPVMRIGVCVPEIDELINAYRLGAEVPRCVIAPARHLYGLSQKAELTHDVAGRHAMGHGTEVGSSCPGALRCPACAEIVHEDDEIKIL